MRLCFFNDGHLGLVRDSVVHDVSAALDSLPMQRYPFPRHDMLIGHLPSLRGRIEAAAGGATVPVSEARFQSPVANPGKVVAAPVNYRKHLDEAIAEPETYLQAHVRQIQETGLFLKATSSVIGPSQPVRIRHLARRTDHEVELAVVIGRRCDRVGRAEALDCIAGYCIGLDITVLGPWLVTADELGDPTGLELSLSVNGEPRQRANTRDLILGVPELIEFASSFYTLEPGNVLLTGTPEGVGPIQPGDEMRVRVEAAAKGGRA